MTGRRKTNEMEGGSPSIIKVTCVTNTFLVLRLAWVSAEWPIRAADLDHPIFHPTVISLAFIQPVVEHLLDRFTALLR